MSANSKIEWTDATWNPVIGCTKVSPGCDHCYAIRTAHRMQANPNDKIAAAYGGTETAGEWTGQVNLLGDRLDQPLRWRTPKRIFVNAQSDLFHESVPDEFIARVFAVMALADWHTFQILTKRHGRMRSLLTKLVFQSMVHNRVNDLLDEGARWPDNWDPEGQPAQWPLSNVWLGVSVENQQWADTRIPALLDTPAAVRFLSCEPLLGSVSLFANSRIDTGTLVDWVIVGGESGPGARPMQMSWARGLRNECVEHGIPFHFKQWGEWIPCGSLTPSGIDYDDPTAGFERVGKKAAGRELDGRTWDEYPQAVVAR